MVNYTNDIISWQRKYYSLFLCLILVENSPKRVRISTLRYSFGKWLQFFSGPPEVPVGRRNDLLHAAGLQRWASGSGSPSWAVRWPDLVTKSTRVAAKGLLMPRANSSALRDARGCHIFDLKTITSTMAAELVTRMHEMQLPRTVAQRPPVAAKRKGFQLYDPHAILRTLRKTL